MNGVTKAALISCHHHGGNPFNLRTFALFHSTPILDRKRRTHWDSVGSSSKGSSKRSNNYYSRRFRKLNSKQQLLRNVGAFAEHLFQSWQHDRDEYNPSSSQGSSWFNPDSRARGFKGGGTTKKGPHTWSKRGGFEFCEDDFEVETIFRSAFGGNGHFSWSFINEEPQRSSSGYSYYRNSWNWRNQYDEEYESSTDSDTPLPDLTSHRMALGLSVSGPLNLDDVKNAYRACALKWHPDRHQGSSKALAEEKFKVCSAAYQSLCDKLAIN
ncbi:hypothetical protein LguiB_033576 [Lonicera macranthoides]